MQTGSSEDPYQSGGYVINNPDAASPYAGSLTVPQSALLDALETGMHAIGLFDDEDRLAYSNKMFRTGWAVDYAEGATFDSIIRNCYHSRRGAIVDTTDIDAWLAGARLGRRQGSANRAFEVDLWDGRWMWLTERRLESGWILLVGQDITVLKKSERTLRLARDAALHASLTDPLTRLPNRRAALQYLNRLVTQSAPFHVAIVDIDNFKQINDRYGHQTGDEILSLFGADLRSLQRLGYFVARLAGDEFLIIGPRNEERRDFETSLESLLRKRAEQCSECKASHIFAVSIGAATYPLGGASAKVLLMAADRAMYVAKSQGRSTLSFAA
jgi:diguanylate cyclase (GGDEF)-like protein